MKLPGFGFGSKTRQENAKAKYAHDQHVIGCMSEKMKPEDMPAWMKDASLLPKKPPTRKQ